MGYVVAAIIFVLAIILVAFLVSGAGPRRPRGRVGAAEAEPVERAKPAADQPTPAASSTVDEQRASQAQKRMPPA